MFFKTFWKLSKGYIENGFIVNGFKVKKFNY